MIKSLITGICIGILIAPDKGSETRKKIAQSISEYKDDAEFYLYEGVDKVKSKAKDLVSSVQTKKDDVEESFKSKADNLNNSIQNA